MARVEELIQVVGMEPDRTVIKTVIGYEAVMVYNALDPKIRIQQQAQIERIHARLDLDELPSKCINMHRVTIYSPKHYRVEINKNLN